jgi:hypothetical protein
MWIDEDEKEEEEEEEEDGEPGLKMCTPTP